MSTSSRETTNICFVFLGLDLECRTQKKKMDYLLRVAEEQYGRTRDPYLLDVFNLADFCYRKWGDTSDYDRLLRMIHREPLFGLAPTHKPWCTTRPTAGADTYSPRGQCSQSTKFRKEKEFEYPGVK